MVGVAITFTPNQGADPSSYTVEVKLDNLVVFQDDNVTNGSRSSKKLAEAAIHAIVFQNHWDSGVRYKDVRMTVPD